MADDIDIFEEPITEKPGVLEKINEWLKTDIRVSPEFWGQRELADWEKLQNAKKTRQTVGGGVATGSANGFEATANWPKYIGGEKLNPGTFAELDEIIVDPESSTGEKASAYAQSVPRLLLNITEGLFGHTAERFRKRSDRYKEGMTTDEIVKAEVADMNEAM